MKLIQTETGQKFMVPTTNNKKNISHLKLSIQVSLSGLSFCILNYQSNTIEFLKSIAFEKKLNPNLVLDKLQHVFNSEKALSQTFSDVLVIHKNELSTLVPKALFNEDNLADYLKFNNKILSSDFITFDEIKQHDSINVYVPYININNYLYDLFGEFTYKHYSTIFIGQVLKAEKNAEKTKVYVNVCNEAIDIAVVDENNLILYNTFEIFTKEDFIYYILFTAEQLKLNPETLELIFTGNIDSKDELYAIAYKYIRFVFFSNRLDSYKYAEDAQPQNNHSQFVLLNSF